MVIIGAIKFTNFIFFHDSSEDKIQTRTQPLKSSPTILCNFLDSSKDINATDDAVLVRLNLVRTDATAFIDGCQENTQYAPGVADVEGRGARGLVFEICYFILFTVKV